jgi:hypothetical protein
MTNDEQFLIESLTTELIALLMEEAGVDLQTAMDIVYRSDTYKKLLDIKTGLYFQSPRYVFDFLNSEIITGKENR